MELISTTQLNNLSKQAAENWIVNLLGAKPGRKDFWPIVDLIMAHLYKRYPDGMHDLEVQAQFEREQAERTLNKYAASPDKSLRKIGLIPEILYMALRRVYGVEDREWPIPQRAFEVGFVKRYKKFQVAPVL